MPVKSERQRKAMGAACRGKSTLGIPKSVGCKMLHHKGKRKAKKRKP